jgi:hypothetical protein
MTVRTEMSRQRTSLDKKDHIIYFMSTILPIPLDDTSVFDLSNCQQLQYIIIERSTLRHPNKIYKEWEKEVRNLLHQLKGY